MNHLIPDMNDLENQVLTEVVRSLGATLFDLNSYLGLEFTAFLTPSELKLALLGLCKKGWVIRMRRIAGERVYCVPYERYIEQMTAISMDLLPELTPMERIQEDNDTTDYDLVIDMMILVGWISRIQPRLNKKGQLDKKLVDGMMKHIRLAPEHLITLVGEDAAKISFPLPVSILIDLGLRLGTVQLEEGHIRIDQQRMEQWLAFPPSEVKFQLYRLWCQVHYPEQHVIRQFLVVLPHLRCDQWFSVDQLFEQDVGLDHDNLEAYLLAFQELGWLKLGRTTTDIRAFRSRIGTDEVQGIQATELDVQWYVQPDYEIIVPSYTSYSDYYSLHMYAILIARNQMYTFHITKDSVFTAFQHGWTVERILNHLMSRARYGVPDNIQISLTEWDKQYRGVQLEVAVILRCGSVAIAEELMTIPEMKAILNEQSRMQPDLFLIPMEIVDFVREKMNIYGYQTDKKSIVERRQHHRSSSELVQHSGIIHSPLRYDMYTRDEQHPSIESLYPGIHDVPSGWMNKYVTYHISTSKQLLQQAIDWQCYVQAAYEGNDRIVAPATIRDEHAMMIMEGVSNGQKIQIPLHKLEAICLVLPGIHDAAKYMSTIV